MKNFRRRKTYLAYVGSAGKLNAAFSSTVIGRTLVQSWRDWHPRRYLPQSCSALTPGNEPLRPDLTTALE
ncbi:MAG: hypothetical protein DLM73_08580 [Chthoniobacterales bacterium]|nr:MAG: hypothetical protein DLM73_08580 [Chthoniobacterales bacterium]